jgi:uncharacterized protein YrrD
MSIIYIDAEVQGDVNMLKMELKEGTRVVTSNGNEVGKVNRFVIDPVTDKVTHIVVQKGWLLSEDKVVPLDMVNSADEHDVILSENMDDFNDLPPFEETHFVRADEEDADNLSTDAHPHVRFVPAYYWYPPSGYLDFPTSGLEYGNLPQMQIKQNIPDETVALKEGSGVISSDGKHVGDVERLFVEKDSKRATHFLISQGLLFKDRKVVPAHWVKSIEEDKVYLAVSSNVLESLPSYKSE